MMDYCKEREMKLLITTSKRPDRALVERAQRIAADWGMIYVPRERHNVSHLCDDHGIARIMIVEAERLLCVTMDGHRLFWHPNMTGHKLKQLLDGGTLPLMEATAIQPGDFILDGTLGYGSDALLLAHGAGPKGYVLGIEQDPIIACLTQDGLVRAALAETPLGRAARRISVKCGNHSTYLANLPDNSCDIVFLDPMFEATIGASPAMRALKPFAVEAPLSPEAVGQALRVCRRRLVIKERWGSTCFAHSGCQRYYGRLQPGEVVYGVIEK